MTNVRGRQFETFFMCKLHHANYDPIDLSHFVLQQCEDPACMLAAVRAVGAA